MREREDLLIKVGSVLGCIVKKLGLLNDRGVHRFLDRNIAFREQSKRELADAEEKVMEPLRKKLREAIALVAKQQGLAFVLNTDSDACPYIDPLLGQDINDEVNEQLSGE